MTPTIDDVKKAAEAMGLTFRRMTGNEIEERRTNANTVLLRGDEVLCRYAFPPEWDDRFPMQDIRRRCCEMVLEDLASLKARGA